MEAVLCCSCFFISPSARHLAYHTKRNIHVYFSLRDNINRNMLLQSCMRKNLECTSSCAYKKCPSCVGWSWSVHCWQVSPRRTTTVQQSQTADLMSLTPGMCCSSACAMYAVIPAVCSLVLRGCPYPQGKAHFRVEHTATGSDMHSSRFTQCDSLGGQHRWCGQLVTVTVAICWRLWQFASF